MTITYYPSMSLFKQSLHPSQSPTTLAVTHQSRTFSIPLNPSTSGLSPVDVVLHASTTKAYDMGSEINAWFSACFGFEVKLVFLGPHLRAVLGNLAPNAARKAQEGAVGKEEGSERGWLEGIPGKIASSLGGGSGRSVKEKKEREEEEGITFADVAAYLVITEESLEDVSSRLPEEERPMDITKFRPNIVLSGSPAAYDEDFWGGLSITSQENENSAATTNKETNIILTQNCARCVSLNVDYETGKIGTGESGQVLKKLMKDRRVDSGSKWSPIFGRYGFLERGAEGGTVKVGDEVVVTKRNEQRTTFGK